MTAKVNSLADQVERMATKDELGQLRSEVATQVQATGQLKQSFDTLYQLVYRCCLKPSADTMIGILSSLLNGLCSICTSSVLFTYKIVLTSTLTDYVEPILLQACPLLPMPQGTIAFPAGALTTPMFIVDHTYSIT